MWHALLFSDHLTVGIQQGSSDSTLERKRKTHINGCEDAFGASLGFYQFHIRLEQLWPPGRSDQCFLNDHICNNNPMILDMRPMASLQVTP